MFYLMSVVAYIKARIGNGLDSKRAIPYSRITFFLISLVSAVLAMMTKENAFTLPFVIVLYEFCFFSYTYSPSPIAQRRSSLDSRFYYLIPILLTMLLIPVTILGTNRPLGEIISDMSERLRAQSYLPRWDYLMTQLRVITTYIRLIFLPVNQNMDYDYPVYHSFFALPVILSFVFLAALFGLGVYMIIGNRQWAIGNGIKAKGKEDDSRPFRLVGFGILWFFITLSVESSVIPIADVMVEHRLYLPLAGALIALTTSAFMIAEKLEVNWKGMGKALIIALSWITIVLSGAAFARNMVWQDEVRLWKDIAMKSPNKPRVHYNLGFAFQARNMPDKAMEQYLIAVKLRPDYAVAHNNLGIVYQALNMPVKAMEQYLIAIKIKPDFADAHNNLGVICEDINMSDEAVKQFLIALKLRPDLADAHFNLGFVYYKMGQVENARRELTEGLKIKPEEQRAQQLLNQAIGNRQ